MKLKVYDNNDRKFVVEARVSPSGPSPSGATHYVIEYLLDGELVYSCGSRALAFAPSPIEALKWQAYNRERDEWETVTHGEYLADALDMIAIEEAGDE